MSRQHWSLKRVVVVSLSVVVWLGAGLGVPPVRGLSPDRTRPRAEETRQSKVQAKNSPLSRLPGTLYLVQDGTVYRLGRGVFTAVLNSPGGAAGTQPHSRRTARAWAWSEGLCVLRSLPDRPGRKCSGTADPQHQRRPSSSIAGPSIRDRRQMARSSSATTRRTGSTTTTWSLQSGRCR